MAKHVTGTQVTGREKAWARVASKSFLRVGLYKVRKKGVQAKLMQQLTHAKAFHGLTV